MAEAVFMPDGPRFVATELARGPWDPKAQHGGAPAALLMRAFERLEAASELVLARVTYEFLRPVPLAALSVDAHPVRAGRRVALLEGSIVDAEGTELVRARALRVRAAGSAADPSRPASGSSQPASPSPPPGPDSVKTEDFFGWARRPMFATDAMDIRFLSGHFAQLGPSSAWFRLRVPLVAGEETSPLQRLAAAADFGNGIGSIVSWEDHVFINPDLTMYIAREPTGQWMHLDARMHIAPGGVGLAQSALRDEEGPLGHATQALVVQRRG